MFLFLQGVIRIEDGAETQSGGGGPVEAAGRLLALAEAVEAAEAVAGGERLERAERAGGGTGGNGGSGEGKETIFREMG